MKIRMLYGVIFLALVACSRNLEVQVLNESDLEISNIEVKYKGAPNRVDKIESGKQVNFILKPSGETDVGITYLNNDGEVVLCKLNQYVESGYRGKIFVKIDNTGCFVVRSDVTVY